MTISKKGIMSNNWWVLPMEGLLHAPWPTGSACLISVVDQWALW